MRKKIFIISFLILVILGSLIFWNPGQFVTKAILKMTGNYATPRYETSASILSKTKSDTIYYDRLYKVKNYATFDEFQKKKLTTFPFVQIYNRNKKMLKNASGNECSWMLMNFFTNKDTSNLVAGDSLMYDFVMERLEPIDVKTNQDTFNYYVVAGWANYIPRLSDDLFVQTNKMKKSLDEKVCFTYINFDMQEDWKVEMEAFERSSKK